jgi:hypothetical protein
LCESGAVNVMDFNIGFTCVKDLERYEPIFQDVALECDGQFTADFHTSNIPYVCF